jgi:uncharacterized protein YjdB
MKGKQKKKIILGSTILTCKQQDRKKAVKIAPIRKIQFKYHDYYSSVSAKFHIHIKPQILGSTILTCKQQDRKKAVKIAPIRKIQFKYHDYYSSVSAKFHIHIKPQIFINVVPNFET